MNTSRIGQTLVLILAIMLFAGCASTGVIRTTTPISVELADYKTVLLCVSSQVAEPCGGTVKLAALIHDKLRDRGLFEKILVASGCSGCPADLKLNAQIVEAGQVGSRVVVDVALTDMSTGTHIGSFEAEGKSSGEGATRRAIERAAEEIVGFLKKNM